jgi:hypothetical protein
VKVKEEIANFKIDPTFDKAIFSYIDKVYIEKFSKYIYTIVGLLNMCKVLLFKGEREIRSSG